MPRVKRGIMTHKRHHKILKLASGYWGGKHRLFKSANEAVMKSGVYAFRDRRNKKRDFRRLWIARINIACRINGMQYSRLMNGLKKLGCELDRKSLANLAVNDAAAFTAVCEKAKAAL